MSESVQNSGYSDVLGVSTHERTRLLEQAKDLEPETRWLLDRAGTGPGWRAKMIALAVPAA